MTAKRPGRGVVSALVGVVIVGLMAASGWWLASGWWVTQATPNPAVVVGIDVDPFNAGATDDGNGTSVARGDPETGADCLNSTDDDSDGVINDGCGLGAIDNCIRVESTETGAYPGPDDFEVDVFLNDIPTGQDMLGFGYRLNFDNTKLDYTGDFSHDYLGMRDPDSSYLINNAADGDGFISVTVTDGTVAAAEGAGEYGVLGRYKLDVIGGSGTLTYLWLSGTYTGTAGTLIPKITNTTGGNIDYDQLWDSNYSPQYGVVAIDQACAPPTATPLPSATPSPTGTALPTPAPTPPFGQMLNCPSPGKWAIAVYNGPTASAVDALATCTVPVDVAYSIDPDTQAWSRYFRGRPEISNLASLENHQGVVALGSAATSGLTAGVASVQAQQAGQLEGCPEPGKWAISVWNGTPDTPVDQALATCPTPPIAAYWIDPETQLWARYFTARPEISNLEKLDSDQGVLTLGSTAPSAASRTTGGPAHEERVDGRPA